LSLKAFQFAEKELSDIVIIFSCSAFSHSPWRSHYAAFLVEGDLDSHSGCVPILGSSVNFDYSAFSTQQSAERPSRWIGICSRHEPGKILTIIAYCSAWISARTGHSLMAWSAIHRTDCGSSGIMCRVSVRGELAKNIIECIRPSASA
jgi:hypothetical protein